MENIQDFNTKVLKSVRFRILVDIDFLKEINRRQDRFDDLGSSNPNLKWSFSSISIEIQGEKLFSEITIFNTKALKIGDF